MLAVVFSTAMAHAGVTVRKVGQHSEILRVTGLLMKKGGAPKPKPPRLSYSCTISSGMGVCELSVVSPEGEQVVKETLDVAHDDGDLLIAGRDDASDKISVSRKALSFEWDTGADGVVLVLVPGS